MLKGKLKFAIAICVITLTISYLVYSGAKEAMVYYLSIEELVERVPQVHKARVRVSGVVVPDTIVEDDVGSIRFQITDSIETINVAYNGIVPDIFADEVEAVVEGIYTKEKMFEADTLLAKCPTKYEDASALYEKEDSY